MIHIEAKNHSGIKKARKMQKNLKKVVKIQDQEMNAEELTRRKFRIARSFIIQVQPNKKITREDWPKLTASRQQQPTVVNARRLR